MRRISKCLFLLLCALQLGAAAFGQMTIPVMNAGTTGTTLNETAIVNSSGNAIVAGTINTGVPTYIVIGGGGTVGQAQLAVTGPAYCTMDSTIASAAGWYYVINSTSTPGDCHAQSAAPSGGTWVIGYLESASTTSGAKSLVHVSSYVYGGTGASLPTIAAHTVLGNAGGSSATAAAIALGAQDVSPGSYMAAAGSVNALTVALAPAATSYVAGLEVLVLPNLANTTTTPTLNLNGLGAKTITKLGTAALAASDLTTTAIADLIYDGTEFQLMNPQTGGSGGSMVYPAAGIPQSTGSAWGTSLALSVFLQSTNNLSDLGSASTARTNLGLGAAATQALSAFLQPSNNLSELASASTARTNLGLGTSATQASSVFAQTANNLSDLANAGTARTNLGFASGFTGCAGTAAGDICYYNGSAWTKFAGNASGTQYFSETSSGVPGWGVPGGSISGLTTGVIPVAASSTTIGNSSPQLDVTTNTNGLTFGGSAGVFAKSYHSTDTVNNAAVTFGTGSSGDSTCPAALSGTSYLCTKSSGISASVNGAGYSPILYASIGLQSANNLSELASASTARTNLGLGTAAVDAGPTGTIVGTTDTQTLTNKSIAGSEINSGAVPAAQIPAALSSTTSVNGTSIPSSVTLTQTVASGTATLGTSAIASGACATTVTATATGGATTDVIQADFNASPIAITGYGASATGAVLSIYKWVTANTANFSVCNSTAVSITPGAATLNWRINR